MEKTTLMLVIIIVILVIILLVDMIRSNNKIVGISNDMRDQANKNHKRMNKITEIITDNQIPQVRDKESGLLNETALRIYKHEYESITPLYFTAIQVYGIEESDQTIEDVMNVKGYASNKAGIEIYKAAASIPEADIYRLDKEVFVMIYRSGDLLGFLQKLQKGVKSYNELGEVYIGTYKRVSTNNSIDRSIGLSRRQLINNITQTLARSNQ